MIQLTNELMDLIDKFEEQFNTMVPIRQIGAEMTTEHLIKSIQTSLNDNVNYLPEILVMLMMVKS